MIKILGIRSVIIFGILIGLICVVGLGLWQYLMPKTTSLEQQTLVLSSELSKTQNDLDQVVLEYQALKQQMGKFKALEQSGFLSSQSRDQARDILKAIEKEANVNQAAVSIGGIKKIDLKDIDKTDRVLLQSDVDVDVSAIDDLASLQYVYLLATRLPGHTKLKSLVLKREIDLSGRTLRRIASGEDLEMVSAALSMTWHTLTPKAVLEEGGLNQ